MEEKKQKSDNRNLESATAVDSRSMQGRRMSDQISLKNQRVDDRKPEPLNSVDTRSACGTLGWSMPCNTSQSFVDILTQSNMMLVIDHHFVSKNFC